jgi:hypothetical protein
MAENPFCFEVCCFWVCVLVCVGFLMCMCFRNVFLYLLCFILFVLCFCIVSFMYIYSYLFYIVFTVFLYCFVKYIYSYLFFCTTVRTTATELKHNCNNSNNNDNDNFLWNVSYKIHKIMLYPA